MSERASGNARIFPVNTRFQQMAKRPGGVTRDRAIEDAQHHIDDLKLEFDNWLDRELGELVGSIRQIANDLSDKAVLNRAHQTCRQLQDVGTTMGFELVTFIANNFCDILDAVAAGAAYDQDMIDCHIDALLLARAEPYRNLRPEQVPEMTRGLRRMAELATASASRDEK
jgi:hypothetical protein